MRVRSSERPESFDGATMRASQHLAHVLGRSLLAAEEFEDRVFRQRSSTCGPWLRSTSRPWSLRYGEPGDWWSSTRLLYSRGQVPRLRAAVDSRRSPTRCAHRAGRPGQATYLQLSPLLAAAFPDTAGSRLAAIEGYLHAFDEAGQPG